MANQEKLKQPHQRQSQNHKEQAFNSQSEESADFWDTLTTLKESVLVLQFTSPPFSNTWLLKFWNSPVTLQRTTRRPELSQDTFCSPSETTKNSTSFCPTPQLLKEVSSPTSAVQFTTESNLQENQAKLYEWLIYSFCYVHTFPSFFVYILIWIKTVLNCLLNRLFSILHLHLKFNLVDFISLLGIYENSKLQKYQFSSLKLTYLSKKVIHVLLELLRDLVWTILSVVNDTVSILNYFLKVFLCFLVVLAYLEWFSQNDFLSQVSHHFLLHLHILVAWKYFSPLSHWRRRTWVEIWSLDDWKPVVFSVSLKVLWSSFNFFSDWDLFAIFRFDNFVIF